MMSGAYAYVGTCVCAYECRSFYMNVCKYIHVHTYVRDPVRLRLRHLYQVEFCSFIVRYPTAGASVYCEHVSSSIKIFRLLSYFSSMETYDKFCVMRQFWSVHMLLFRRQFQLNVKAYFLEKKNMKNIINLLSAEFTRRVVKLNLAPNLNVGITHSCHF